MVDEQYEMGKWKGMDTYKCFLCSFVSLDKSSLEEHWRGRHRGVTPPPSPVLVADMRGKEVTQKPKKRTKKQPAEARPARTKKKVEVKDDGKATLDGTADAGAIPDAAGDGKRG